MCVFFKSTLNTLHMWISQAHSKFPSGPNFGEVGEVCVPVASAGWPRAGPVLQLYGLFRRGEEVHFNSTYLPTYLVKLQLWASRKLRLPLLSDHSKLRRATSRGCAASLHDRAKSVRTKHSQVKMSMSTVARWKKIDVANHPGDFGLSGDPCRSVRNNSSVATTAA